MISIKVTNCNFQSGSILARNGFAKITWGLIQRPKSAIFSFSACGYMYECMYGWMDVIVFFVHDFFHTVEPIEENLKTYH